MFLNAHLILYQLVVITSNNCCVILYLKMVILLNIQHQTMIGEAKQTDGLYILRIPEIQVGLTKTKNNLLLWHYRIGHPSNKILKHVFPSTKLEINSLCNKCETFVKAKMCKKSFSIFYSTSYCCFDLIHLDVWEPDPIEGI